MIYELPIELFQNILQSLDSEGDLNAMVRTASSLYHVPNPHIYRRNAKTSGSSALTWAAIHGQTRTAEMIIDAGVSADIWRNVSCEAVRLAALHGHKEVINLLLSTGRVDGNARDGEGETALSRACEAGQISVTDFLLGLESIDPNLKNMRGLTPLSLAACRGHSTIVESGWDTNTN